MTHQCGRTDACAGQNAARPGGYTETDEPLWFRFAVPSQGYASSHPNGSWVTLSGREGR